MSPTFHNPGENHCKSFDLSQFYSAHTFAQAHPPKNIKEVVHLIYKVSHLLLLHLHV